MIFFTCPTFFCFSASSVETESVYCTAFSADGAMRVEGRVSAGVVWCLVDGAG